MVHFLAKCLSSTYLTHNAQASTKLIQTSLAEKYSNVHEQMKMQMEDLHIFEGLYKVALYFLKKLDINRQFYDKAKCTHLFNTGKLLNMAVPIQVITNWSGPDKSCH